MPFVFGESSSILYLHRSMITIFIWTWIFYDLYHLNRLSLWFLYTSSIYFIFRQIAISIRTWSLTRVLLGIFLAWFCWLDSYIFHWLFLRSNIIKSSRGISTNSLSISFSNTIMSSCCKINSRVFIWTWNFGLISIWWRSHRFTEVILSSIEILMLWKINLLL